MSFSKKLAVSMLCITTAAQAHGKPGFFDQIKAVYKAGSAIGLDNVEVHPTVQALSQEAQTKVGVPNPLPIKYMNPQHPQTQYADAVTTKDSMYLNNDTAKYKPIGIIRSTLFHEAVHAKYEDPKTVQYTVGLSALTGAVAAYTACRKLSKSKRVMAVVAVQAVAGHIVRLLLTQRTEKRADREGFNATGCSSCLEEIAAGREMTETAQIFNPFNFFKPYISSNEIRDIAKTFADKKCTYHATPEKQEEAQHNITVMQNGAQQNRAYYAILAEQQAAEHAATDKEEQCMRRFQ